MRVLVYKRTHEGDPDASGCFGAYDCMGQTRWWDFEAVIGVGGIGDEPTKAGIAGKITWIGIGPRKFEVAGKDGPDVYFKHFRYKGQSGECFRTLARNLSERMYVKNIRAVIHSLTEVERTEVDGILKLAETARSSPGLAARTRPVGAVATSLPVRRKKVGC